MSTYELPDDLAKYVADTVWSSNVPLETLAEILRPQIPVLAPTKLGAVVRCDIQLTEADTTLFVRWTAWPDHPFPWLQAGDVSTTHANANIGRITEVLFEGVDL